MPQNLSDPVKRQVDAYNRKDIDEFVACYSPDVVIEDATGAIVMRGHDAMRAAYSKLFRASPNLQAEIATRILVGEYVIDEERITGRRGSVAEIRVVAIYHVADDVIDHVRVIR